MTKIRLLSKLGEAKVTPGIMKVINTTDFANNTRYVVSCVSALTNCYRAGIFNLLMLKHIYPAYSTPIMTGEKD
ncbi:MAG: hypothetical protein KAV87_26205 [Desulfobacteraceae bacterium]|nr:hypothetical protein [Desulfobacteraceae bacterium]